MQKQNNSPEVSRKFSRLEIFNKLQFCADERRLFELGMTEMARHENSSPPA